MKANVTCLNDPYRLAVAISIVATTVGLPKTADDGADLMESHILRKIVRTMTGIPTTCVKTSIDLPEPEKRERG
jgi:hypothetical protein